MHRVLNAPEILDRVFSYTDDVTDAKCATVNKNFFEASSKSRWHSMEKLQRVFSILGPIIQGRNNDYEFSKPPSINDWERFYIYASKIRHIKIDAGTREMEEVYQEVARSRTQLYIFPNLISLDITLTRITAKNAVLFLPKNLQEITVRAETPEQISLSELEQFLASVVQRTECLSDFNLQGTYFKAGSANKFLGPFFRDKTSLKRVALPLYTLTTSNMNTLASLKNLRTIRLRTNWGEGDRSDVASFAPNLTKSSFPALRGLEFVAKFRDAKRFFSAQFAPGNLTSLFICATDMVIKPMADFFNILANTCQNFKCLEVNMIREIESNPIESVTAIGFDLFRPLSKLKNLENVFLYHPKPLIMSNDDIDLLAKSWTALEELELNSEPLTQDDDSGLKLSCLQSFARHCPKLRSLSIYLDGHFPDTFSVPGEVFKALDDISFGFSLISDPKAVADYLSQLLNPDCELVITRKVNYWEDIWKAVERINFDKKEARIEQWEEVKRLFMIKTTQMYKDTIADLEEEIRTLRRRLGD